VTEAEIQVASAAVRGAPYAFRSEGAQIDFKSYLSPKNFGLDLLARWGASGGPRSESECAGVHPAFRAFDAAFPFPIEISDP
jgi:hypothetical protein